MEAERRKQRLESLMGKEPVIWANVEAFIATKQPKKYDAAVSLLQDLRDLAKMKGKNYEFSSRMSALCIKHKRKPTLLYRFQKAKLMD